MSGLRDKLQAIDDHLGQWVKVSDSKYLDSHGNILYYNKKTNRLILDGTVVMLDENGSATLGSKFVAFECLHSDLYHLIKRPITKNKQR